jgi:hypothetical protein
LAADLPVASRRRLRLPHNDSRRGGSGFSTGGAARRPAVSPGAARDDLRGGKLLARRWPSHAAEPRRCPRPLLPRRELSAPRRRRRRPRPTRGHATVALWGPPPRSHGAKKALARAADASSCTFFGWSVLRRGASLLGSYDNVQVIQIFLFLSCGFFIPHLRFSIF